MIYEDIRKIYTVSIHILRIRFILILRVTRVKLIMFLLLKQPHQDLERPKLERRTPSTSSTKSSTFSLFPTRQNNANRSLARKVTLDRSPLSRCATAPGAITQQNSMKEFSESPEQAHVFMVVHSPAPEPSTTASKSLRRGNSSSGTSHRSQSPTDFAFVEALESPIEASPLPLKQKDLPTRKSSIRALQKPTEVVDAASLPPVMNNTPASTLAELDVQENKPRDAAEISIARQISVSRRQRHLLVPIVPKTARQPMQPTVVDAKEPSLCSKSHHRVLESF